MDTITVYTTGPSCMQCTMTKRAMTKAALPFEEVNLRVSPAALEYVQDELGYDQAPVVVAGDEDHWSGFQPDEITRLAALHAAGA
ncbi:glutaredoxin-like protein NrdH [Citricoccus sp. NPDC055426]|uniref:glutaredoxin-like protein NrdH n=1 Tax=Citricoccus sp. NPDC055426 TaxID=3155536 RepID=UPI0034164846